MSFLMGLNRPGDPFIRQIKDLIGIRPGHLHYYREAFIPKSSVPPSENQNDGHQERLEFLGDAILEAVISDFLFKTFPSADEGFMSKVRAKIVNRDNLNRAGKALSLNRFIKPPIHQNQHKKNLLGNTLEALIGAIFLDKGWRTAQQFIVRHLIGDDRVFYRQVMEETDFKSVLVEWGQKNKEEIDFLTTESESPGSTPQPFASRVKVGSRIAGSGSGASKKEAEQNAAQKALKYLKEHRSKKVSGS